MAANAMLPLQPVAGDQWATAAANTGVTLSPLDNDIAYNDATIDPSSINLNPTATSRQTSMTVYGGSF